MPRDTSNSGRTGMGGSMSGGSGWGGSGGSGSGAGGGGGGWGSNLRGADGMTASQRAQTRDSRLGLQTGNTWHGNTAFGRPGQQAYGFATSSNQGATFGQRPTMQTFSNFRRPDGSAMFPGAGGSVQAPNAFAGAAMMQQQMMRPQARPQPGGPQPAGAPPPGQPLTPHPFPGLTKPMLPGFFGGGVAPYQYNSMGPWPGQSAIPNNPPVYTPAIGVNNIQSGDSWLNNGYGAYGWNMSTDPAQGVGSQHSYSPPSSGNGFVGGGIGGGGGGGWGSNKVYNDRVPSDPNKMSTSASPYNNKMAINKMNGFGRVPAGYARPSGGKFTYR